jgi:hypothetical protein
MSPSSALMMEAVCSSETLAHSQNSSYYYENLKSYTVEFTEADYNYA